MTETAVTEQNPYASLEIPTTKGLREMTLLEPSEKVEFVA